MRGLRVWVRLLGLRRAVIEDVKIGEEGELVVDVRPNWRECDRCGICRRRSPGFDLGEGRRRWRAMDLSTTLAYVEADAPRVTCRRHGVVVCAVPWARHNARFTSAFEDQVAWLAVNASKSAVAELMRIAWRTVGAICECVCDEAQREVDLLDGLRRIGIDEVLQGRRSAHAEGYPRVIPKDMPVERSSELPRRRGSHSREIESAVLTGQDALLHSTSAARTWAAPHAANHPHGQGKERAEKDKNDEEFGKPHHDKPSAYAVAAQSDSVLATLDAEAPRRGRVEVLGRRGE